MAFNSCRIPAPGSDVAYIYATSNAAADGEDSRLDHIVVMRRGCFFSVNTTVPVAGSARGAACEAEGETKAADSHRDGSGGAGGALRPLTVAELAHQFRNIVMIADLDASAGCARCCAERPCVRACGDATGAVHM